MKNEWDFLAYVQERLASGDHLVTGYFQKRLVMPPDEQRGLVLDEGGTIYELGDDFKLALNECIRGQRISWCLRFQERLICFGPGVNDFDKEPSFLVGPEDEISLD